MQYTDILSSSSGVVHKVPCNKPSEQCVAENDFLCKDHWIPLESPDHSRDIMDDCRATSSFFASDATMATQFDTLQNSLRIAALLDINPAYTIVDNSSGSPFWDSPS
ncbi:2065_t:CDS:1, partial [Acaulospora colombiana]